MLLPYSDSIRSNEPFVPPGCIDAPAGSTLTLEYGAPVGSLEPAWQIAFEDEPVETGDIAFEFVAPDDVVGKTIFLRATVTDPTGRRYVAYSPNPILVQMGESTGDDDDGCGCRSDRAHGSLALFAVLAYRRRRRR
jgi:MYXO-CTERM domain-containing protein